MGPHGSHAYILEDNNEPAQEKQLKMFCLMARSGSQKGSGFGFQSVGHCCGMYWAVVKGDNRENEVCNIFIRVLLGLRL